MADRINITFKEDKKKPTKKKTRGAGGDGGDDGDGDDSDGDSDGDDGDASASGRGAGKRTSTKAELNARLNRALEELSNDLPSAWLNEAREPSDVKRDPLVSASILRSSVKQSVDEMWDQEEGLTLRQKFLLLLLLKGGTIYGSSVSCGQRPLFF